MQMITGSNLIVIEASNATGLGQTGGVTGY